MLKHKYLGKLNFYLPAKITWLGRMGMCWDELDNPYGIDNLYLKYTLFKLYMYFKYNSNTWFSHL